MSESNHKHPFLDKNVLRDQQELAILNSNADLPVRHLIQPDTTDFKRDEPSDKDEQTHHRGKIPAHKAPVKKGQQPVEAENLSEFSQWLLSLKRPSFGDTGTDEASFKGAEEIAAPEVPVKKKKKKKKEKEKKKKKKGSKLKTGKAAIFEPPQGEELISDTLAELIARQGYIEEAINMFDKLVELYPEKADYYLQRIAQLKLETNK